MGSKGRIISVDNSETQRRYGGVRGGHGYENTGYGYYSGYGSFNEYPEPHLTFKARIYDTDELVEIEMRDAILNYTGRRRITSKYMCTLEENEGLKIWFEQDDYGDWYIEDLDQLYL